LRRGERVPGQRRNSTLLGLRARSITILQFVTNGKQVMPETYDAAFAEALQQRDTK
jgi:hypothetical protein